MSDNWATMIRWTGKWHRQSAPTSRVMVCGYRIPISNGERRLGDTLEAGRCAKCEAIAAIRGEKE